MDTFDLIVVIMWSRLLYLHGRKSNTTSSPAFSRDICRMFPQNIWKLNQHRTSLQRESLCLIHYWKGGREDGFTGKPNVTNLKIAKI